MAHTHITSDRGQQIRNGTFDVWHDARPAHCVGCSKLNYYSSFTSTEDPFVRGSEESPCVSVKELWYGINRRIFTFAT